MASEGADGNSTPSADLSFDKLPEGVGDDEDWDFAGSIGEEPAQRVGKKRKL